jgi:hypothetical protein
MDPQPMIDVTSAVSSAPLPAGLLSRELQQLWFSLDAHRWSSLLIVPAPGVTGALPLAIGLLHVSRRSSPESRSSLLDGTGVALEQVATLVQSIATRVGQRERVLVVVDPVEENPAALALASCCDAALLCVSLGRSDLDSARDTLERCGRARFLGSVALVPRRRRRRGP